MGNKLKCQFRDQSVHICSLYNGKFMFCSEGIFLEWLGCTLLPQVLAFLSFKSRRNGLTGSGKKSELKENIQKICMFPDDKDAVPNCSAFVRHLLREKQQKHSA